MDKQSKIELEATPSLWLPNIAPRTGLTLATFMALILIVATTELSLYQPSININWTTTPDNVGLVVKNKSEDLSIPIETRVIQIKDLKGNTISLHNEMLLEDPDQYATYAAYNAFFKEQQSLMRFLSQQKIILVAGDGREYSLNTIKQRCLVQLPVYFWLMNISAGICFLIGCGVWLFRRGETDGRLMAIIGLGYFISILCLSIYNFREIAMNATLFLFLSAANHLCMVIWCYSLLLLFICYPLTLINKKVITGVYTVVLAVWLNQTFQWYEIPLHTYYLLNHVIPYILAIIAGYVQWRKTVNHPLNRAMLRWFILSIWITIGTSGALFIIPGTFQNSNPIPLWIPASVALSMFICFAFGILKYGLFDLERWWFTGWVWFVSGLLITGIDILTVIILDISFKKLLPYSILFLGWIYFPLRQWIWYRLVQRETNQFGKNLPMLIQSLFTSHSIHDFTQQWSELLGQVFKPLNIITEQTDNPSVIILQHGLELQVPDLSSGYVCRLIGNRQGTRLFGQKDIELVSVLIKLSQAIFSITNQTREIEQKGAAMERERIMRDLHDDVLPKLISIKQQSSTHAITRLAEAAFQSTRETIYLLRYPSNEPLENVLADWRGELAEQVINTNLTFSWHIPEDIDNLHLTSRQVINCGRIIRESVSNIIQHADAKKISISFNIIDHRLHISVSDNGKGANMKVCKGLGTNNMRSRAKALKGNISWISNTSANEFESGLTVLFSFPLPEIKPDQGEIIKPAKLLRT